MQRLCEVEYQDLYEYGQDYRVILHVPDGKRKYYALKDNGETLACCEVKFGACHMEFNCVFVPEQHRGHGYAFDLIMQILFENQEKSASAQANDWSIKTFLKAGFQIGGTRKCKYWTAYFVSRKSCKERDNGKTKN